MDKKIKKRYLLIVGVLAVALGVTIIIFLYGNYFQKGTVSVEVTPDDANYSISGTSYSGNKKKISLKEGKYKVVFSRDLFENKTLNMVVVRGMNKTYQVILEMKPGIVEKFDNLNESEKLVIEKYEEQLYVQDQHDTLEKFPFLGNLPYITEYYRIDYGFNDDESLNIIITTRPAKKDDQTIKDEMNKWLKDTGINLNDYKVYHYYEEF